MESEVSKNLQPGHGHGGDYSLQVTDCTMRYEKPLMKWNEFFLE